MTPSTSTTSPNDIKKTRSSLPSHIAVDLSSKTTPRALQSLSKMAKRMSKIKSALVSTSRADVGIHGTISLEDVGIIFAVLGQMPNLTHLVIDLNRPHHYSGNGGLPLTALNEVLCKARRLQSLQLRQLDVTVKDSSAEHWKDLCKCLTKHKRLHNISVVNCMGKNVASVVAVMAKHARSLRQFRLVGSSASSYTMARLTSKRHHPELHTLQLEDIPDITDDQIGYLRRDLEDVNCSIRELHIRSSALTEVAGDHLSNMLCYNTSLTKLVLHLDCERLGHGMAQCFWVNTTLREVDIRCYGDDEAVAQSVVAMANALHHSPLQKLRLCLEIEPLEYQKDITDAFQKMILADTNTSLHQLIVDDGFESYPLSEELKLQLELNRCGYSRFIRRTNNVTAQQWMKALEAAGDDLTVIYTILSNCPWLANDAAVERELQDEQPTGKSNKMDTSSKRRLLGSKRISLAATMGSGKNLRKMVRSMIL